MDKVQKPSNSDCLLKFSPSLSNRQPILSLRSNRFNLVTDLPLPKLLAERAPDPVLVRKNLLHWSEINLAALASTEP
jgi:hypothetical protein